MFPNSASAEHCASVSIAKESIEGARTVEEGQLKNGRTRDRNESGG